MPIFSTDALDFAVANISKIRNGNSVCEKWILKFKVNILLEEGIIHFLW